MHIEVLDDGVGVVEEQLRHLTLLHNKVTADIGNDVFGDLDVGNVFENILEKMDSCVSDLYALKNQLLDKLTELAESN